MHGALGKKGNSVQPGSQWAEGELQKIKRHAHQGLHPPRADEAREDQRHDDEKTPGLNF